MYFKQRFPEKKNQNLPHQGKIYLSFNFPGFKIYLFVSIIIDIIKMYLKSCTEVSEQLNQVK